MDLKKVFSWLLTVVMLFGSMAFAEDAKLEAYAKISWDGSGNVNGSAAPVEGVRVDTQREKVQLTQLRGGGATYMALLLSKSAFPNNGKSKSIAVTVRYYDDSADAYFTLDYTGPIGPRTAAGKVEMTGDHTFKEHTFYIDECYFKNDNAGGDILIATWTSAYRGSKGPVYIQWVEIKESFPQKPVNISASNGKLGNVFDIDEEKLLNAEIKNLTDTSELSVCGTYEILSYDKKVIDTGALDERNVAPGGIEQYEISLNISQCGGYYFRAVIKYRGEYNGEIITGEVIGSDIKFSVINKHDPDEKLNPMMRTQVQFQNNGRLENMVELYQMVADAGMSGVREYLQWNTNTAQAPYNPYLFEKAFDCTESLGMTGNMGVIMGHPSYGGVTYLPVTDEAINALCDYSEWWVKLYGDKFEYFEVWNEPNVYGAFNINYATPQQYTELVKAVYKRIKAVNPKIKVVALSTATIHDTYINSCIEAGILDYCDAVSCHPYDWDTGVDETGRERVRNDVYRERAAHLRKKLDDAGYPDIEISWTEMGVRSGAKWASEVAQASYLTQLMAIMQGEQVADNIYQFMFVNPGLEDDLTTGESHWGLIYDGREKNGPYAAKLSYVAMAGYNKFLSDAEPVTNIVKDKTSAYCFRRDGDGKNVAVLWCDNSYDNIGINLGTNEVEVYDMYSNKQGTLKSNDGKYSFTATFEPMYVVGNFTCFEEANPFITIDNARAFAAPNDTVTFTITDKLGRNLKVEAEARDSIEVLENNGMINGSAVIRVKTDSEAVNENTLKIKLYDDECLTFATRVHAVITKPMSLTGTIEKVNNISARTVSNVSITNISSENVFSGTVTADFSAYGGGVEKRTFDNIKPKETVNVQLNIPESLVQRTFDFKADVDLDYGYSTTCNIRLTQLTADYAEKALPVSGILDYSDWSGGDFYAADRKIDVRYINDWEGKEDCSVIGKLKWDEKHLYLLADVTDDVFYQDKSGSAMWSGDSIQFGVCTEADRHLTTGGSFSEFGLSKTPEGVQLFRFESLAAADKAMNVDKSTELEKNVLVENCECSVEQYGNRYIYRAKIPWSEILPGVTEIESNMKLGFSMIVNDNDGNGRGWLQFSDGIGQTKSSGLYSMLTLSGKQ